MKAKEILIFALALAIPMTRAAPTAKKRKKQPAATVVSPQARAKAEKNVSTELAKSNNVENPGSLVPFYRTALSREAWPEPRRCAHSAFRRLAHRGRRVDRRPARIVPSRLRRWRSGLLAGRAILFAAIAASMSPAAARAAGTPRVWRAPMAMASSAGRRKRLHRSRRAERCTSQPNAVCSRSSTCSNPAAEIWRSTITASASRTIATNGELGPGYFAHRPGARHA